MKKIFLQVPSPVYANNKIFEKVGTPNNTIDGWYRLKNKLANLGYDLTTADDNSLIDCKGIIFLDADSLDISFNFISKIVNFIRACLGKKPFESYPKRKLYEEANNAGYRDKMVLLIWEGSSVCPENFSKKTWGKFDHIITWDSNLVKSNPKFHLYCMPMESHQTLPDLVPFDKKKLLVNISYNKISSDKDELYSARRKSISYFNDHFPNDFDLYGIRWDKPVTRLQKLFPFLVKKFSTYRGRAGDKLETLSRYKFNLCYENNSGTVGRITEKIFNAIKAGTVPVYWGSKDIEKYVDEGVFIDRRKFVDDESLALFLTKITESEYEKYMEAGQRYMKSEKYTKFLSDSFCDRMIEILREIGIIA